MYTILIISPVYSQTQHIKAILQAHSGQYQIIGSADNSVLGMSLIESVHPDIVIMPVYMNFWNAEDLINYLLLRGTVPRFILLSDNGAPAPSGAAASWVTTVLSHELPTEAQLLRALQSTSVQLAEEDVPSPDASSQHNPSVQHSLEIMELLMGLIPLQTGEAHRQFGRLRVGGRDCWVLLGTPRCQTGESYNFFAQINSLETVFTRLTKLLEPLGPCELCIYRESNLCILLADGQRQEPDWDCLTKRINQVLAAFGTPTLLFEISDVPLPLERWHSQCQELLRLRQVRFFYSPSYLQPKTQRAYQIPVTQTQIHDKLSSLTLALQGRRRQEAAAVLQSLEEMVSHSLSQDLYSFVTTQLTVQYSRLRYSYGLKDTDDDLALRFRQFSNVQEVFAVFSGLFMALYDQLEQIGGTNPIVAEVCGYINQNLSEPLTLEIVAEHVHVSPTYLCRLFKRETGCSFNHYISQRRILRAMQLLEAPYKIIDIAGMVGFENSKYFSQVFKKHVGKTPQEYRLELRKKEVIQ